MNEERITKAIEDADFAFWAEVAASFPEISSGDFPPAAEARLRFKMEAAIRMWVKLNPAE